MSRKCTICSHDQRKAIDEAIANNQVYSRIFKKFGVTENAIGFHKRNHIAAAVARLESRAAVQTALTVAAPDLQVFKTFTSHARMLAEANQQLFLDFQHAPSMEARVALSKALFTGLDQAAKRDGAYIKAAPDAQDIANLLRATYPNLTAAELRLAASFAPGLDADAVVASFEQSL